MDIILKSQMELEKKIQQLQDLMDQIKQEAAREKKKEVEECYGAGMMRLKEAVDEHSRVVEKLNMKESVALDEITRLRNQIAELEQRLMSTEAANEMEMEKKIKELEAEHAKTLKEQENRLNEAHQAKLQEAEDRIVAQYRAELGSIRSRFRLMSSSMEKSPSDSSLEKMERNDVIELVNHEAIVAQTKEDAEIAQEEAVAAAIENERQKSKARADEYIAAARARMEDEKRYWLDEAVTRAMVEKNRQADLELSLAKKKIEEEHEMVVKNAVAVALAEKEKLMETLLTRQQNLATECQRHRDTIRLLTDADQVRSKAGTMEPLKDRVEFLERENRKLLKEMAGLKLIINSKEDTKAKGDHINNPIQPLDIAVPDQTPSGQEMVQSVAIMNLTDSGIETTSQLPPKGLKPELASLVRSLRESGMVSFSTCCVGEAVLVMWNPEYSNFMVVQDNPTLHFLHPKSLDFLRLRPFPSGSPRSLHEIAVVQEKELCKARRMDNRYRVAMGTQFYRVLVKPIVKGKASLTPKLVALEHNNSST